MFYLNQLKQMFDNGIIIIFIVISYFLIFKTSKLLKEEGYKKDYKIVKYTGVFYGLLAVVSLILISMY